MPPTKLTRNTVATALRGAVLASALAGASATAAADAQSAHHARVSTAVTTVRKTVTPGHYLALVSLRARAHAQTATVSVAGQTRRRVRVSPAFVKRLSFVVAVSGRTLVAHASSEGPGVKLAMTVSPQPAPPAAPSTPAPLTPIAPTTPPVSLTPPPPPAPALPLPLSLPPVPAYTGLVWQDAFDEGPVGSAPSASKWNLDQPGAGCGDPQQSHGTASTANASLVKGGGLAITALATGQSGGNAYTSAQLDSAGTFSVDHGTIEASMVLPAGQGLCSAFWMVGDNVSSMSWPNYGELDVMEALGNAGAQNRVYADLHGPVVPADPTGNDQQWQGHWDAPAPLTGVAHTYAINWNRSEITWTLDGVPYASVNKATLPAGDPWLFDGSEKFHLMLDLAVGGWPGPASGWSSATLQVNWVRVYQ